LFFFVCVLLFHPPSCARKKSGEFITERFILSLIIQ
jgi:hypothetical protein